MRRKPIALQNHSFRKVCCLKTALRSFPEYMKMNVTNYRTCQCCMSTSVFTALQRPRNGPVVDVSRLPRRVPLKLEPKAWFANERTFLAWASMAVAFAGTSAALTALTTHRHRDLNTRGPISPETVSTISLMLGPASLGMLWYGFFVYRHRNRSMANKSVGLYDDRIGPVVMASLVAALLGGMTCITYFSYFTSSI